MTTQAQRSGERYGDFELVRYLTAGGMADLWLARSPRFDGDLVIKKIQPRYVDMTRVVKMFIDEGRIAQALDHPNIVRVLDVGHESGTYFIAMEYIPGRDLLAICRRGIEVGNFLPRHLAVAVLAQAARGLVYAHELRGPDGEPMRVVHCDISPGNIVVGWGGTVKLVDFGIARATIMLRAEDHSVAGKYNYMAPEQIRGERVDARADLFALGVILYELTVGRRLFRGRPEQVMRLVLEEPIARPSEVVPDFPPALEAIVMRALERDPARRYQTARDLRTELMAWLAETGLSHDKRRIAEYLRAIFYGGAKRKHAADAFGGDGDDDDELILEKALPRPDAELRVDPEDLTDTHRHRAPRTRELPATGDLPSIHDANTAPIGATIDTEPARADADAPTGPVTRADADAPTGPVTRATARDAGAVPMADSTTEPLRADTTKKRVPVDGAAEPPAARPSWWRRLWNFLRGK